MIIKKYTNLNYRRPVIAQLKAILGSPEDFIKLNYKQQNAVNDRLKNFSVLKENTSLGVNVTDTISLKELYCKEFKAFNAIMNKRINDVKIKRKDSMEMANQIKLSIEVLSKKISKYDYIEKNQDLDINIPEIFKIILKSSMSSRSYLSKTGTQEAAELKVNEILHSDLISKLLPKIVIHFSLCILKDNIRTSQVIEKIYDELNLIITDTEIDCIDCLTNQLIEIFIDIFNIKVRNAVYKNSKTNEWRNVKVLALPKNLMKSNIMDTNIPEITPIDVTFEEFKDKLLYFKKVKNGISTIDLSEETKDILQISQKKKLRINYEAVKLFEELDKMEYGEVKDLDCLPFTPIGVLDYFEKSIRSKKSKINPAHLEKISKEYHNLKKEQRFEKNIHKYFSEKLEVPIAIIKECDEYYNECKEFKKRLTLRRVHNTYLEFAKIFDGFPIYFIESFDYRLRMYPYSFMFGRTSGIYKYLVKEYTETELTDNGYFKMLESFFQDYPEEHKELKELIHKKENINIVIEWTNENIDKIENKTIMKLDSFFYKMLLKKEIKKLPKNEMRTGFMIESDQKSSSFVIAAIIFDDYELAKCSNLTSFEAIDPPRRLMKNSSKWFKGKVSNETLKILSSQRNLHKYLLMCFLYSQGFGGRRKTLLEYGIKGEDATYVANKYIEFINVDFEILTKKKDYLIEIVKYFLTNSESSITIDTLDNSRLSWTMFKSLAKKDLKVKKYKSPITGKNISYRPKNLYLHKRDTRKILSGFLASYIHSIDGAIMRLILKGVYKSSGNGYIISHLHDSIQYHPNQYYNVMESVRNVYSSDRLKNVIDKTLFENLEAGLPADKRKEFNLLVSKFNDCSTKKGNITAENIKPRLLYPLQ